MENPKPKVLPILIAMKGHPGTGKSTLATALATTLKYPLIDKDDIRDATISLSTVSTTVLNDLSYAAMWRVASTQLRLGLSIIVDSPLSNHRNLTTAVNLAGGSHRVVVVECKAKDEEEWRRRVEKRGEEGKGKGHKPATWKDMERLIEGYDGCYDYEMGDVPKLVVDTTTSGRVDEVLSSVLHFLESFLSCDSQQLHLIEYSETTDL